MVKIFKIVLPLLILSIFPGITLAADLSITPSAATFETGELVTLRVMATSNVPLNAISGSVHIPVSNFTIESISKADSILSFWVAEPSMSKATGVVNFEGVALNGFVGSSGTVLTIRIRAINTGDSSVNFNSGQIFANDGQGTNITKNLNGARLHVIEPKLKPVVVPTPINSVIEVDKKIPEELPEPDINLKAPEIVFGSKYGNPAIYGTSNYSNKHVVVNLTSKTGNKVYVSGMTDANGDFNVMVPKSLKRGEYTVTAVVLLDGKNSMPSNEITIKIGHIFSDIGYHVYALIALLLIVIIYQVCKLHHSTRKYVTGKIRSDLDETDSAVHKSFDILREDIKEKKLSSLKSDIDDAEELLSKKINKIESL